MRTTLRLALIASVVVSFGCDGPSTGVDGGPDRDGGRDGGGSSCTGAADGTACGSELHCIGEVCVATECGDGFVDEAGGELCDDGNEMAFDGCEPGTCTFTCDSIDDCDDGNACTGADSCGAAHVCEAGTPPAEGSECTRDGGAAGVCRVGECVDAGCGNGVPDGAEQCDDMNDVDGDGCDNDCTFSCEEDLDCADGDVCDGDETCDTATHACTVGTALDCDDESDCTADACDPIDGCANTLIDMDGDGHAATSLGACGDDCDDDDSTTYGGAPELCEASAPFIDNDCNPATPNPTASLWYLDCDEDGFASTTAASMTSCAPPPPQGGCGWTSRIPIVGDTSTADCNDANDDVFPGQTAYFSTPISGAPTATRYDYDCNGSHSRQYGCVPNDATCGSGCSSGYANRSDTNSNGCTFLCLIGGACFVNDYPDCGESANYNSCGTLGSFCRSLRGSPRTQACR